MIEIHPTARVSHLADIEDSQRGSRIVVGAHSVLDSFVKVKPAGGSGDLCIGEHVVINSGCVLYTGNGIAIGNHVAIAANCTFAPVNHATPSMPASRWRPLGCVHEPVHGARGFRLHRQPPRGATAG